MSGAELTIHGAAPIHGVSATARQCTAHARSGAQCKRRPIKGGNTCSMHGGGTKAAKSAGLTRLLAARDPAIDQLVRLARKGDTDMVKLRAVEGILDRTGLPRGIGMPEQSEAEKNAALVAALTDMAARVGARAAGS